MCRFRFALALSAACIATTARAAPAAKSTPSNDRAALAIDVVPDATARFSKLCRGKKTEEVFHAAWEHVTSTVPEFASGSSEENPTWKGLRQIAAELAYPEESEQKKKKFRGRTTKEAKGPSGERVFPLPQQVMYRFGFRELLALDDKNKALAAAIRKRKAPGLADVDTKAQLEALLNGGLPETELAIAEIQRRLDIDVSADRFAQFLETWRNWGPYGEESFYEALDRTAGTPEEVFFYDAMLADFVGNFAPEVGKRWTLQTQHDKNQHAFLTYRQYRGFIEAASYALVLAPDVGLPSRLKRYDYDAVSGEQFALRHQLDLMLEFEKGDVAATLVALREFLAKHPLPSPIWDPYDPVGAFGSEVKERLSGATGNVSGFQYWKRSRDRRAALAEKVRAAAKSVVED